MIRMILQAKRTGSLPAEEEEDNEPKPWDEYFNSLK